MNFLRAICRHVWQRPLWVGVLVLVLGVGLRLVFFLTSCKYMEAFDDECITALQAMQIAKGDFSLFMLGQPYVFPIEAYLMAPVVALLPRTAFGARVMAFGFGLVTLGLTLLVLRYCGRLSRVWPGALLLLFGSSFLLILQSGCALPGYPTLMLLFGLTSWLVLRNGGGGTSSAGGAFIAGTAAGLACSGSFLALPFLVAALMVLAGCRPWFVALKGLVAYIAGAAVGLMPYLLARLIHGGGAAAVFGSVSYLEAYARLTSYLPVTLANAMGIGVPVVMGSSTRLLHGVNAGLVAGVVILLVLLVGAVVGCVQWGRNHWRNFPPLLYFAAVAWACLLLFLFGGRAHSSSYRYLTLAVMSFPLIVACLYQTSSGLWRKGIAFGVILLALFNVLSSVLLIRHWARPAFTVELGTHDLTPVVEYLRQRHIRYAYASYADAYRITYKTDQEIVCAQPFNERFPGWPLPFKAAVDEATNVAYVLTEKGRFPTDCLNQDLTTAGVDAVRSRQGQFDVFTDFSPQKSIEKGPFISMASLKAAASHAAKSAHYMVDDTSKFWRCEGFQQMTGMWVSVVWAKPHMVQGVVVAHGHSGNDFPEAVNIFVQDDCEKWVQVATNWNAVPEPFTISSGHPVYGDAPALFVLPESRQCTGVKIEIAIPRVHRAWTVDELKIWGYAL